MKKKILVFAILATAGSTTYVNAEEIIMTSYVGITNSSQIAKSIGFNTVVSAVNVGSISSDTVNDITFAADTTDSTTTGVHDYVGNGYTAYAGFESSSGISGAAFTQSTANLGGLQVSGRYGSVSSSFDNLKLNTNYAFDLFLSDNNNGRGTVFSYALGSLNASVNLVQNLANLNRYQVEFNTGSVTTFSWGMVSNVDLHDAKLSGFALYEGTASVPEPSGVSLLGIGLLGLIFQRHRKAMA